MSFISCHDRGRIVVLQDKVPLNEKLDQIMAWIDLPLEKRPQFISGSFFINTELGEVGELTDFSSV